MGLRVSVTQSLATPVGDHFSRHHTFDHFAGLALQQPWMEEGGEQTSLVRTLLSWVVGLLVGVWPLQGEPIAAFMIWLLVHESGKGGKLPEAAESGDVPVLTSFNPKHPAVLCGVSEPFPLSSSRSHCLGSAFPDQSGGTVLPRAPMAVVVLVMKREARCGWWGASPLQGQPGLGWARGITCSCACPSADAVPPGAGPGNSHRHWWGLALAPEPPVEPGNGFSGTGCRHAPLPGWMGTAEQEAQGWVDRSWKKDPIQGYLS